ncbi:MAG TPA: iron-sulfur cluster assembly scaffold protein [Pyrinomonadaceae bacterium]|nr:iron-sulfur cluster assembly scaffold protein [Pyrinomonadaceae bacterium]
MSFYPEKINKYFRHPKYIGKAKKTNAVGTGASFVCGSFVRFYLEIVDKEIKDAKFKSNGCGFTIAAADVLAEKIIGKNLTKLHGLNDLDIEAELEKFPAHRKHCLKICIDALAQAFADFRALQIEEFAGEKTLICTCFGVSEERIEKVIIENEVKTVEEIGEICNAGTGCGSCQVLIQEMLDAQNDVFKL